MRSPSTSPAELLARLVSFDTTSHKTNLSLIGFVEDYLKQHGIASERVTSDDGTKANLFATIGPAGKPGVALSGHTDVVPVDGQVWDSDPFSLTERDGRFYGRGTADMKGFLACCLASVPGFLQRDLATPIHLAFSYDEEIGCIGVRPMVARLGRDIIKPRMVIVGEPTSMRVVDAHKGPVRWNIEVIGRAAHSSMSHLGVNAIAHAAQLIDELRRIEKELKDSGGDPRFDPAYPTLQVTRIDGGTATNIIPVSCRFTFDVRALPGIDIDAIEARLNRYAQTQCLPAMRAIAPEADITISRENSVPPFLASPNSEAVALCLSLLGSNETWAVSYATEAGLFQDAGAPAVVCGPGSIDQAHTANEWIAVSEIDACMAFLDRLGAWAAQDAAV
jgi:acetylornithine deacetylase